MHTKLFHLTIFCTFRFYQTDLMLLHVYIVIRCHQSELKNYDILSPLDSFYLNSEDPNEMLHFAKFHLC